MEELNLPRTLTRSPIARHPPPKEQTPVRHLVPVVQRHFRLPMGFLFPCVLQVQERLSLGSLWGSRQPHLIAVFAAGANVGI